MSRADPDSYFDLREPRLVFHDWRDANDRREVFEALLNVPGGLDFNEMPSVSLSRLMVQFRIISVFFTGYHDLMCIHQHL